ncbi:hypothetical protein NliqN6_6647 [Naganishia liquefaciens]|uniref:Chromosome transmission fidelity protein 8 n=1 Tax=Naganishia liquefaciens TaxID=104408 RepID=A0A8H3TZU8_9TREE|nr:hypothetical protein NliqN6_6647 [Naganishia liquefaciens]
MRISLTIPTSAIHAPAYAKTDPPLVQLAGTGELVIIELQGELNYEGDPRGKVAGLLSFERMDKPTLHLGKHHLLHGKIVSLPHPLAVIRRVGPVELDPATESEEEDAENLSSDEQDSMNTLAQPQKLDAPSTPSRPKTGSAVPGWLQTPKRTARNTSAAPDVPLTSSPPPAHNARDYSSDLSSPFPDAKRSLPDTATGDKAEIKRRKVSTSRGNARTKEYETVAIVRRKIVFGLRPEPIVTATVLPE